MHKVYPWRPIAFVIGVAAGAVGCYGAYEYGVKLEGGVTYLAIAAPLVAAMAAIIPPLAEDVWKQGAPLKATLWWLCLVPVVAVVFYASAERVHHAKAGQTAEIGARQSAVSRAEVTLSQAREALKEAEKGEAKAKGFANCGQQCRSLLAAADTARANVDKAEKALTTAQTLATQESPFQAPVWLLPVALDLIAFIAIWSGLSGPWVSKIETAEKPKRQRRKATTAKAKAPRKRKAIVAPSNDNVVTLNAG